MNAQKIRKELSKQFGTNFELDVADNNFVILKVISEKFSNKSRSERKYIVTSIIGDLEGIFQLYTEKEALLHGIEITPIQNPITWGGAVNFLTSGNTPIGKKKLVKKVVFYSYKGGVGRTTALVQTAFNLIRNGKRVVLIDMDFEAPGLQAIIPPKNKEISHGLVDYLWERQNAIDENQSFSVNLVDDHSIEKGIVYALEDTQSRRSIFVIPAGKINDNYITQLSTLSIHAIFEKQNSVWSQLEIDICKIYQPDVILIDARTGFNDWGASTLFSIADEAFIVMYPSTQNLEGIDYVRNKIVQLSMKAPRLVISPIPEGEVGSIILSNFKKNKNYFNETIDITYNQSISSASSFPVEQALPEYAKISNIILESELEEERNISLFLDHEKRKSIIESLKYPKPNAEKIDSNELNMIFQKTADFDRLMDDSLWVIRGKKGTGKSTLYALFIKDIDYAKNLANGRLNFVQSISGHGIGDEFRPTLDIFEEIANYLIEKNIDWTFFWRAYAVIKIFRFDKKFRAVISKELLNILNYFELNYLRWEYQHSQKLMELCSSFELTGACRDAISKYNDSLSKSLNKIWLFYDDLDQDIKEDSFWQQNALGGLMRFIYDANNINLFNIRFKVFVREDIWDKLVFTNKSHFGSDRSMLLKWEIKDFLRLAYRLSVKGSPEFQTIANRFMPISDHQLNELSEEKLRLALSPLWGVRQQKSKNAYVAQWVYSRLTDAQDNTYPRSLSVMLNRARLAELDQSLRSAPTDHLLRWSSLTDGLKEASKERCNAIKNEYEDLSGFFSAIESGKLGALFKKSELETIWKNNNCSIQNFEEFIRKLELIGLISVKKYNAKYDYEFAKLYIDGFGIRLQGQRK